MTIFAIVCAVLCLLAGGFALAAATFNGRYHHKASAELSNKAAKLLAPAAVLLTIIYYLIRGVEYGTWALAVFALIMAFHLWRERARESGRSSETIPDRDGISEAAHSRLFLGWLCRNADRRDAHRLRRDLDLQIVVQFEEPRGHAVTGFYLRIEPGPRWRWSQLPFSTGHLRGHWHGEKHQHRAAAGEDESGSAEAAT